MGHSACPALPLPYNEPVQSCRACSGSAAAAGPRAVALIDDLDEPAGLLTLVLRTSRIVLSQSFRGGGPRLRRCLNQEKRRLTNAEPFSPNRQARSVALEIPIRGPRTVRAATVEGVSAKGGASMRRPFRSASTARASPSLPGPEQSRRSSADPRRLHHEMNAMCGLQRADQHARSMARFATHDVQAPMDAIRQVDVCTP